MTTNPYVKNFKRTNEQNLIESLNIEAIQMYGLDFVYLPRENQKEDLIFGEDTLSKFSSSFEIEMFIKNVDGHEGAGDILSKFGLEIRDKATFTVSKSRFLEVTEGSGLLRPREGDLLYFDMPEKPVLFEILFVEQESVFYQLGDLYVYDLQVVQFRYSHEKFDTGYEEIDVVEDLYKNPVFLALGTGTGVYDIGEIVYQGTALIAATASGEVIEFDETNKILKLKNLVGTFELTAGNVIGNGSGSTWTLNTTESQDFTNDVLADNKRIQVEADDIVDKTEKNPFSENDF